MSIAKDSGTDIDLGRKDIDKQSDPQLGRKEIDRGQAPPRERGVISELGRKEIDKSEPAKADTDGRKAIDRPEEGG
jgi:hypothetical protein